MDIKSTRSFRSNRKAMIASTRKKRGWFHLSLTEQGRANKEGCHHEPCWSRYHTYLLSDTAVGFSYSGCVPHSTLHLTWQNPGSQRGRHRGFSLTDPCQEGEEEPIPRHGKDDPRQGEHGAQQAGSQRRTPVAGEDEGGREKVRVQISLKNHIWLSRQQLWSITKKKQQQLFNWLWVKALFCSYVKKKKNINTHI